MEIRADASKLSNPRPAQVTGVESRPELNGQEGRLRRFDEGRGRYVVKLSGTDESVRLKTSNVVMLVGTPVVVSGAADPELDGKTSRVS